MILNGKKGECCFYLKFSWILKGVSPYGNDNQNPSQRVTTHIFGEIHLPLMADCERGFAYIQDKRLQIPKEQTSNNPFDQKYNATKIHQS